MLASGPAASELNVKRPRSRRLVAVAAGLWLAFGVIAWNNIFDRAIRSAEQEYLDLQIEYRLGRGPAVTMRGVMEPAIRRAALTATLWAGVPTLAGLLAVLVVATRRVRAGGESSAAGTAPG